MDKFVANCKTVCSFLFGRGVVSQYGKVYFDSPEVAKVLGNVEYKEVMLLERYFTRIIRYHTFVIRRRVNRKYEYILLCKVNGAETVLVTPDYETILKANEEYTSMVKILESLDCYEPVTLKFPRTNIWGDETEEHWHFRPCVGGMSSMALRESDSRKGLSGLPRCYSRGTWGGVKATPISTIYRYIKATV